MKICEWYRANNDCYINIPDSVEICRCKGDLNSCPYPINIEEERSRIKKENKIDN